MNPQYRWQNLKLEHETSRLLSGNLSEYIGSSKSLFCFVLLFILMFFFRKLSWGCHWSRWRLSLLTHFFLQRILRVSLFFNRKEIRCRFGILIAIIVKSSGRRKNGDLGKEEILCLGVQCWRLRLVYCFQDYLEKFQPMILWTHHE